jgi:acyl-CoA synthetase (NDP forming)
MKFVDPTIAVSLGNQVDLTVSDFLREVSRRDDVDCIGVYVEGFNERDGLNTIRAMGEARTAGKTVVFYKAGRTEEGRTAVQGHTASLAGDWNVCVSAMRQAGALVATTFADFEHLLTLSLALNAKKVAGRRVAAISNAGYETVGMADATRGESPVELAALSQRTADQLCRVLEAHQLTRLVNVRNPIDLTPMADDDAYEGAIRVLLQAPEVDALIVAAVPMTPQLLTTTVEIEEPASIAQRVVTLFHESSKPLVFVVDAAGPYAPLADKLRQAGVPVFGSADQAIASLARYLDYRLGSRPASV